MSRMSTRFQRAALISEAARLEHYILDQQAVTDRHIKQAEDQGVSALLDKLTTRGQQLEKCRALANQLRIATWNLD